MTLKIKILILLSCVFPWMRAVADPIVTSVGSGSICPNEETVIPVTVSNCNGVTAISLALNFDNTKVSYQGYQNLNSAVSTMLINQSNGTIYMTWAHLGAVDLGNGTLVELRFVGISGSTGLNWNTNLCEYSDATGTIIQSNYSNGSVNVYAVPTITSNPIDRNIVEGQNTTFEVGVSGHGLSYQWQIKTPVDNTWQDLSNGGCYSNVNSWRLNVNNVTLDMDGNQYRCTVSGTCPSPVTSEAATLSVNVFIPTIVTSVGSVATCADQVFSVPVTVTNCNNVGAISLALNYNQNLVTYIGYENVNPELSNGTMRVNARNGVVYFTWASSNHILEIGNGGLISLVFRSASGNSSLSWNTSQCEYSTRFGVTIPSSYSGSNLNIYFPPSVTSDPTDKTVTESNSTNFSINASGQGLSYQWQMSQDQGISWETLSNGGHYSNVTTSTLNVNNVVVSMDGYRYRCQVNGTCEPSVTSNYATLHVETLIPTIVTTAGSLNTCSQTEFGIPISVTNCNNVGAISLALSYNTDVLTFAGYEGLNPALDGGYLQVNAVDGMVFIAWSSVPGASANVGNGNLITIKFTALSGTSDINWQTAYCEYANPRGVALQASYNNGNVSVGDLSFTITSQPTSQTVTMEESTTFAIATDGPTSGFQWQVSQDGGVLWSNISTGEHYANPTTTTLNVNNVTLEMNGYRYRCVISGSCGAQYSSVATLTVQLPPNYYEITLAADPTEGGTTEGAGAYEQGTPCTAIATPATGYEFVNWTENGTEVSQEASYTFTVEANRNLVAHFTLQEISINVDVNPIGGGIINGDGTYLYGSHVLLTAIPITGSIFDNWTENGEIISTNQSISFTAQTDRNLVANFSVQQVNITATPVPANNGSVEGAGIYAYGATVTLVAHAEQGFQLSNWTENGVVVSTSDTLVFMAENDRNLEANFITRQLNITAVADPEIGGTITGAGIFNYGDPVVLTATPLGTAEFLYWEENGVPVSDEPTYSFVAYEDHNLVAHFLITIIIAVTVEPEESGVISGSGTYNYGQTVNLIALPNTGYTFMNWTESDTFYSTNNAISFMAVEDRNFVAHFDPIIHHINVVSNSDVAGSALGGGDYQEGSLALVTAQPNHQFEFVRWTENGANVSVNPNYTFTVWNDRNLVAEFQRQITDTTAYSCEAFTWHGHTCTTEGVYYDTLTSYLGIDSIVRLNFHFYPKYYFNEERFVCDSLSIIWRGQTLTNSGVYYDSLVTVNGCDSIYELSIEFFRTPVGNFSYMTPVNNAAVTTMPLTLAWNSVPGATKYDLYLWDVNDPEPTVPYRSSLSSSYTTVSALMNYHTYNWYVVARNACHEQTSEVKSFHLNVIPVLTVNNHTIDYGEVAQLGTNVTRTLTVDGYYLGYETEIQIVGEDADAFSYTLTSGWNAYSGGNIVVGFRPMIPKFLYTADLIVSSGDLTETVTLLGSVANLYTFNTIVDENVFSMGSIIPIHGSVINWEGEPAANIEVEVGITVMNMKRTILTQTNDNGLFSTEFEPMPTESGYYTVNSGKVGNNSTAVHDEFNIPGMAPVSNDFKTCVVDQGWSKTDSILIRNKSNLPLTNIQLTALTHPQGCSITARPFNLAGLDADYLVYTISGSELTEGNQYQELRLKATSVEGSETQFSVWYYCKEARGNLNIQPKRLTTTMTKGKSKIVDIMLTNGGTSETGTISIEIPNEDWLSVVGSDTLASIPVNDTAYFSLRLSPSANINLIQYNGTIVVHSERGDDKALYYSINAVSESTGSILVDATDEYTYNTNGGHGPHLEGAYVTIKGYYSLETVAQGYTDSIGQFRVDSLPEGYYRVKVSAERHAEYNNTISVMAGIVSGVNAFMPYQAITYSWDVQPTEIEDEYIFDLVVTFETNVPKPVITIDHTGTRELEYGETDNFSLIITNHGLITSYEASITFDDHDEYDIVPLFDMIDSIPAQTTIVVPCQYTRIEPGRRTHRGGGCTSKAYTQSYYYCNMERQWQKSSSKNIIVTVCPININYGSPGNPGGGGGGSSSTTYYFGGGGVGASMSSSSGNSGTPTTSSESCTPCLGETGSFIANAIGCIPGLGNVAHAIACGVSTTIDAINDGYDPNKTKADVAKGVIANLGKCALGSLPIVGNLLCAYNLLSSALGLSESCYRVETQSRDYWAIMGPISVANRQLWYSGWVFVNSMVMTGEMSQYLLQLFNEDTWQDEMNTPNFIDSFVDLYDESEEGIISDTLAEQLASTFVGTSITHDDVITFIERWNRTLSYWDLGYYSKASLPEGWDDDFMEYPFDALEHAEEIQDAHGYLKDLFGNKLRDRDDGDEGEENSLVEDIYPAWEYLEELLENTGSNSVCATVKVKFSQTMTMTREAFNGTFSVHNGNQENSITNIDLDLVVRDKETGEDCTHLFQVNTMSLNNITSIDGDGSLAPGLDGTALIQFIPTKNAAPTEPKIYSFGGTFAFTDPYTDEEVVFDLYPVDLIVNPCPDLYVDYFMQRDILGDDALTEDIVEPSIPAELGVRIHNKGMGVAKNVNLETAEPEIVDNDKGLAVDFAMYGASYNGSPAQLGLMNISFGNIESGSTGVGEWLFTSSLLGHFVNYEAHVIHNNSFGNPELSLVSSLRIHELIHPIRVYGVNDDGINDFLVNDDNDAYEMPDTIYFSQGGKTGVGVVDDISFDHYVSPSDTIVTLTVEPSRVGWNYGMTDDPGMNQYDIVSCIRNNDNQDIPLNNVWQTFVTIPDGGDPVYENKLHIVDTLTIQHTATYTLVFAKKPSNLRIFHGDEDDYWSNAANWEGYILPQANDEVLIDGICQLDEDAEVFSLTVAENQSLTIPEDRILTVSGQLTSASVSRLIIEEGGQLFHGNSGVQATVQKTIMPYTEGENDGWYFIASPLASVTPVTSVANMLDNEYDLYYYNEPTAYWINQEYAPNGFAELVNGKGYLYANSDEVLLGFAGELQSGSSTVTVYLNYTEGGELQGFNLVGNPFVYNLTSYASVNVANGCYQLNETMDDFIVSEIDETNPLKPAEGFFVKATDVGASVTFNPGRGTTTNRSGSIRVELSDDGKLIDRLIVKREGEPLEKMSLKEQRTKLFAMQGHQEIAIVPCEGNEQPINFKAAKNGTYTINVNTNNLEFDYLHLIDNLTGADVDLLALRQAQGPMSYTFEAKTTDYASRFRLVFSVCEDADGDNEAFAFINNGNIIIIGAEADAVLQIVDVTGRILVSHRGRIQCVPTGGMAKGVYVLRLIEGEKVRTQKIVID